MKIVYCLPQLYRPGGIERIVSIKANYLADVMGYDIILVLADQRNKKPFYHLSDRIKTIDLGLDYDNTLTLPIWKRIIKRRALQKMHFQKLKRFLYSEKPDITISTFTHEAYFLPSIKDGSKKVLEFHFCRGHKLKMAKAFHFGFITKLGYCYRTWQEENCIIPKYDQFVVLTEEDRKSWISKIPSVIHISNILPFENEGQSTLDNKHVIAVGRLDAQKGFDRLISIWNNLASDYLGWRLDVYGDGQDRITLQKLIDSKGLHNSITLHHPDQCIKKHYLESSIFVMTSNYEGLPMTLLEATGLGLPSVSYDFSCGPKDVIIDGVNGYIIKEGDEQDFANKLQILMSDKEKRVYMGKNAIELSKRYSVSCIMQQWDAIFNELIKK